MVEASDTNKSSPRYEFLGRVWSYLILTSTCFISFYVDGYINTFGILLIYLEADYPTVNGIWIGLIGGLMAALVSLLAPLSIQCAKSERIGFRLVVIVSALLTSVSGLLVWLGGFVNLGFGYDFAVIGILFGTAFAMAYGPSIVVISDYFPARHAALVVAITTAGTPLGTIVYSLAAYPLIDAYGWRGAHLIFAAISLQGVLAGMVFIRPAKINQENQGMKAVKIDTPIHQQVSIARWFAAHWGHLLIVASGIFTTLGFFIPTVIVPKQAMQYNIDMGVQRILILIWAAFNFVGRLLAGFLAARAEKWRIKAFSSYWLFTMANAVAAVVILIFGMALISTGGVAFIAFMAIVGVCEGPLVAVRSTIFKEMDPNNSDVWFGRLLLAEGFASILGFALPIWLNSVDPRFVYLLGFGCFIIATVLLLLLNLRK